MMFQTLFQRIVIIKTFVNMRLILKLLPIKREGQGLNKEEVEDKQFLSATAIQEKYK